MFFNTEIQLCKEKKKEKKKEEQERNKTKQKKNLKEHEKEWKRKVARNNQMDWLNKEKERNTVYKQDASTQTLKWKMVAWHNTKTMTKM